VTRVAAIDVGTNSVLLLVVEQTASGPRVLVDRARITRLGEGVDRTGRLSAAGSERTLECLGDCAATLRELEVERVAVVGTSALRDAPEAPCFRAKAQALLGVELQVLSGREEAELGYQGALDGLALEGLVAVCDVGGGSTEIVYGSIVGEVSELDALHSLDVGAVRLHERCVHHDPPLVGELDDVARVVRGKLETLTPPATFATWVCAGGTVTTLSAIELGLDRYLGERVHGSRLSAIAIDDLTARLARLPLHLRRGLVVTDPERADVILAGARLLSEILRWAGVGEVVVSDRGVRWGLVRHLLGDWGGLPPVRLRAANVTSLR
jgi:exopolyphosphatase / guanosine-5'-triphosphate,3'-diphosphate pyrophosphatase